MTLKLQTEGPAGGWAGPSSLSAEVVIIAVAACRGRVEKKKEKRSRPSLIPAAAMLPTCCSRRPRCAPLTGCDKAPHPPHPHSTPTPTPEGPYMAGYLNLALFFQERARRLERSRARGQASVSAPRPAGARRLPPTRRRGGKKKPH